MNAPQTPPEGEAEAFREAVLQAMGSYASFILQMTATVTPYVLLRAHLAVLSNLAAGAMELQGDKAELERLITWMQATMAEETRFAYLKFLTDGATVQ